MTYQPPLTMKIILVTLYCFLSLETVIAQNKKLDSLDRLIREAASDTDRIKLAMLKMDILGAINLDSAISLGKKTLQTAQQINHYKAELRLRLKLANNYCYKGAYGLAEEQLSFLERFIRPAEDSADFAEFYSTKGMMYGIRSRYDSSIVFYEKVIGIYERTGKTKSLGNPYSNIAIAYQQQSNYPQALLYQQKALEISEKNKDEVQQAYTIMNMGNTFTNMGDSARAEKSYLDAIKLAKKNTLINVELYGYSNLASMYVKQNKWPEVYEFAMKAAVLGASMGDQGIHSASLAKAATALAYTNKIAEAEALAKKAISIADSSAQPLNIYQAYSSMGNILRLKGSFAAAIPYYEKGFLAMKGSDIYDIDNGEVYKQLSDCFEKTKNYSKALETYKTAVQIIDSARSKDNIRKSTELTMNYEFDRKQQVQQARQKVKDELARTRQLGLISGLALAFLLAVVAFIGFRNKQKSNAFLKSQKTEIENTLTLLKSTQSQLIQSEKMASLGELTAGIAHEIQNPLNFVNNFSEVNTELIDEMEQEINNGNYDEVKEIARDIKENEQKINHHGKRADAIVKSMLQHSRSSSGVKESTDINALCDEYIRLTYHGLRAKDKTFNATIKTEFDEHIGKINIIPQDIGRVILNLLTNAFYAVNERSSHAKASEDKSYEPTVSVNTKKVGDKVFIRVQDNGNGIPQKVLDKIFQPFFTTKPTGEGTGLGLSLSYDIVKAHGGELKVETKPARAGTNGEGEETTFTIILNS